MEWYLFWLGVKEDFFGEMLHKLSFKNENELAR